MTTVNLFGSFEFSDGCETSGAFSAPGAPLFQSGISCPRSIPNNTLENKMKVQTILDFMAKIEEFTTAIATTCEALLDNVRDVRPYF